MLIYLGNKKFFTRAFFAVLMLTGALAVILAGHLYVSLFVYLLNFLVFKEIQDLLRNEKREKQGTYIMSYLPWYFWTIFTSYLSFKWLSGIVVGSAITNDYIKLILNYSNIIHISLWLFGFCLLVGNLVDKNKRKTMRY